MPVQPKLFFGLTATIATIYMYKNYNTLPSFGDIKVKLTSLYPANIKHQDLSNNEHNEQNDIEKNITNPFYYNTSFCVNSSQIKNYNKIVNNRFINNQHFVLYCAVQGLNMVQNVYTRIFG